MRSDALAGRAAARQRLLIGRAEAAVRAAERATARLWRQVLLAIRDRRPHDVAALLRALPGLLARELAGGLAGTMIWAHRSARAAVAAAVPAARLRGLLGRRGTPLRESLDWLDLLAPFRDPLADVSHTNLLDLLFPAPSRGRVEEVIYSTGWLQRIRSGTGLGDPENIAARVATGLALGRSHQEIARDILPAVEGVQSTARRIARTESMRVAAAAQMDCHDQLGDLVIGYQVRATLDRNTRAWHAARDRTVYYLDPGPGQKGMAQCPHPPDEAADPKERPPGTPQTAWNCRCFLVPVLRD